MKRFMDSNFLLETKTAQKLFHTFAKKMPIFDYHNHLIPQEIFERKAYENITQVWLAGDHYKWRAMRILGYSESLITGDAPDYDKFMAWAETVERIPGNPLHHWAHLELQRYFDIYTPLTKKSAHAIWEKCNQKLKTSGFDAYGLLKRMDVRALCTTDEPFDTLEWHEKIMAAEDMDIQVLPTFRPDRLVHIEDKDFLNAVGLMETRFDCKITTLDDLKAAFEKAVAHFKKAGCVLSDHGFIKFCYASQGDADAVFRKALSNSEVNAEEIAVYKGEILRFLAGLYTKSGMGMQLHLGAIRSNNTMMFQKIGANTGFDSVGEATDPFALGRFLDDLVMADTLPNTVLYNLNPADNAMMATMAVNFACAGTAGKVQFGSAWWFLDHQRGIENQLDELMETGLLPVFVGMLTDSRSFTSFSRHEYFRRILCNKLGGLAASGAYPNDIEILGKMVQDICYNNAVQFFGL